MDDAIYLRLARHLDNLPGGFPATESGVELRILRQLFSPEDADLACHLTLIPEIPAVVARRVGISSTDAAERLADMVRRGLIMPHGKPGEPVRYMALHFVVGIWENQVNRLSPELIRDVNEYFPTFIDYRAWRAAPQMRTVPVGRSISTIREVMPYDQAEALVREQTHFSVRPCICRQEHRMVGKGCDKPLESCLTLGQAAEDGGRMGVESRAIDLAETLDILQRAEAAGLVIQPSNTRRAVWICTCCGCCCQVLKAFKRHPRPVEIVSSAFVAALDPAACEGCGVCVERCQMDALSLDDDDTAHLDSDRCIGCGLCVTACPTGALTLQSKPPSLRPEVPKTIEDAMIRLARHRGKLTTGGLMKMLVRSKVDRLRSRW